MPNYSIKLDYESIRKKVDQALAKSPEAKALAYKRAYQVFSRAKNMMLKQFNEHPITEELDSGPRAINISNTLDGYGNLFSFIGFPHDEHPTQELRLLLANATSLRQTIYRNMTYYFRVTVPNREDIENVTQMPWESGNSWAYEVERGISGASHYMYKRWLKSRSQQGIQLPVENMEDLTFNPRPYISEILADFRDKINVS